MKKKCNKCREEKEKEEFNRHPSFADGRNNKCKMCESMQTKMRRRKLKEGTIRAF